MRAYLFDVDGVLSDPKAKQVTEPGLFEQLLVLLEKGELVCLNTGRSLVWLEERILDTFLKQINDKRILNNFIAIGEKGGVWITVDHKGNKKQERDHSITVPSLLEKSIRELTEKKFHASMFFDDTKETMISVEMHDGYDIAEFHKQQKLFVAEIKKILAKNDHADSYKIDPSNISTDIENKHVGKALGAKKFLQFLKEKAREPQEYIAFGDSKSDLEMADALIKQGKKVTFVFVGDKTKLGDVKKEYPITYKGNFSKGTFAYLSELYS